MILPRVLKRRRKLFLCEKGKVNWVWLLAIILLVVQTPVGMRWPPHEHSLTLSPPLPQSAT